MKCRVCRKKICDDCEVCHKCEDDLCKKLRLGSLDCQAEFLFRMAHPFKKRDTNFFHLTA